MSIKNTGEQQYLDLCNRILNEGHMIDNERTGKGTLTTINANLTYDVGAGEFPLITTRKALWKSAIAEILGYLRGYTDAQQFADLGTPTWYANANENKPWLANRHRKGENDMGRVYGAQMRDFGGLDKRGGIDQLQQVYNDLKQGKDNRGEMLMMWKPDEFDYGSLRPCVYNWQFSILNGELYVNAYQRSCDVPLGLVFNMVQVYFMLFIMAKITGLKAGKAHHNIVNAHLYEDQIELMKTQVQRQPMTAPTFRCINPNIHTLEDILTWVTPEDFEVVNYRHHEQIKYPFSV
jgi:thymidylate synthase